MTIFKMDGSKSGFRFLLYILLLVLIIHAVSVFGTGWEHPILEHHGLRQTQTAIPAYWIKQGGPFFSYETPFFGYPWSIPLEFPVYQGLTVLASNILNLNLDQSGRLVNILFYLLSFIPLILILKNLGITIEGRLITLCLFLASPLYLYWSRTFMFESTALFFSTLYLSLVFSYIKTKKIRYIIIASVTGIIGILAKVTTFVLFFIPAGFFIWQDWKKNERFSLNWTVIRKKTLLFFLLVIIPIISVLIWIDHCDTLKSQRDFIIWTSAERAHWNWGTFSQRFSPNTWKTIIWRALYEIMGPNKYLALPLWIIVFLLFLLFSRKIKNKSTILIFVFAYFSAFFIFTNLHVIHDYYQYANTLFFIIAAGVFIHALLSIKNGKFPKYLAMMLALLLISSGIFGYYNLYNKLHREVSQGTKNILKIAQFIKQATETDDVIAIYSTWNHREILYYSERRGINLKWHSYDRESFQRALGGFRCGALLIERGVATEQVKSRLTEDLELHHLTERQDVSYYTVWYKQKK